MKSYHHFVLIKQSWWLHLEVQHFGLKPFSKNNNEVTRGTQLIFLHPICTSCIWVWQRVPVADHHWFWDILGWVPKSVAYCGREDFPFFNQSWLVFKEGEGSLDFRRDIWVSTSNFNRKFICPLEDFLWGNSFSQLESSGSRNRNLEGW